MLLTCPSVYTNAHTSPSSDAELLDELEQLLMGIALMKELTLRTKDYLVSFGERLSTRLFAAYLNRIGTYARQVRDLYAGLDKFLLDFLFQLF
jgi:aspartokinase